MMKASISIAILSFNSLNANVLATLNRSSSRFESIDS